MNALLMNRDGFQMPADGWYQVAPLGEFAHAQAGVVQVVDAEACAAMANRFQEESSGANFAGLLVDFDHFSLDGEKRSEAAGWITALEARGTGASGQASGANGEVSTTKVTKNTKVGEEGAGLFAKIRWSDVGEEAVKGGRYRFLSPVWNRADCVDLGGGRVRPVRLLNAAVTNDPNLKGMQPLSNRIQDSESRIQNGEVSTAKGARDAKGEITNAGVSAAGAAAATGPVNAGGGEVCFKWELGANDRHCPSCAALGGQVHSAADWIARGVVPGAPALFCKGGCNCRLVPTNEVAGGVLGDVPVREVRNSERGSRNGGVSTAKDTREREGDALANVGWTNEARIASLYVRREKARLRGKRPVWDWLRQQESMRKAELDYEGIFKEKGYSGMTPEEKKYLSARIAVKVRNGTTLTDAEKRYLKEIQGVASPRDQVTANREIREAKERVRAARG